MLTEIQHSITAYDVMTLCRIVTVPFQLQVKPLSHCMIRHLKWQTHHYIDTHDRQSMSLPVRHNQMTGACCLKQQRCRTASQNHLLVCQPVSLSLDQMASHCHLQGCALDAQLLGLQGTAGRPLPCQRSALSPWLSIPAVQCRSR